MTTKMLFFGSFFPADGHEDEDEGDKYDVPTFLLIFLIIIIFIIGRSEDGSSGDDRR